MMSDYLQYITSAALIPFAKWVWTIDRKVVSHDEVIKKIDKLTDLLLTKALADKA